MKRDFVFTSESVSEGHPDKVSDRISDAVVDSYLAADPLSRVACETLTTTNRIVIAGEVRGPVDPQDMEQVARDAVRDIGYEQDGFHWKNASVEIYLHAQSTDIAQGVDAAGNKDEGAGDQGIMFGFACDETPSLMPAPVPSCSCAMHEHINQERFRKRPICDPYTPTTNILLQMPLRKGSLITLGIWEAIS